MRCSVRITRESGQIVARCDSFPECEGRAGGREEALSRLRSSITFWLEACPCDQTAAAGLELDVIHDTT